MSSNHQYLEKASYTWSADSIRLILTPGQVTRSTYFYAQEVGYFKTKYPYFTERQHLSSFLIVYTISGKGILQYQDHVYTLSKGQCFFINCDFHHYYSTPEESEWEFLWIHINGNGALGYYHQFAENGFRPVCFQDGFFPENILWEIIRLNQKKDITTELRCDSLIHNLLTELLILNCTDEAKQFFIPAYVREMARYIHVHFKEDLSLEDFVKLTSRSKYYLIREFKKYMGVPVNEYIIETRISSAKELLKYSEMRIGEIAYETGMNNVTHFINLFKARENITPLAYRKKWNSPSTP